MMAALLVAGIGFILAGLLGIVLGIPVKEFSFGNTLILAGVAAACTGMLMLAFWMMTRELKHIARLLGSGAAAPARAGNPPNPAAAPQGRGSENDGFLFGRDHQPSEGPADDAEPAGAPPPRQDEVAARGRGRNDAPPMPEPEPAIKPRRNLMFSSSTRKERERAEVRTPDPAAADPRTTAVTLPPLPPSEA